MDEEFRIRLNRLKNEVDHLPKSAGVYLWKNSRGEVLYVGKAKQLRNRMRQYLNGSDERAKIPLLLAQIHSFDYVCTDTEYESLVLEKNLIKEYKPYFNADFKDDKSYPYIAITKGDVFPAIKFTREAHVSSSRYFGPYTDSRAARYMLEAARRVVPVCSASCASWKSLKRKWDKEAKRSDFSSPSSVRKCFDACVGLSPGVCSGEISPSDYAKNIERLEAFLSGKHQRFKDELLCRRNEAAAELDFEKAARIQQQIGVLEKLSDKQHAVCKNKLDADVIAIEREETIACALVLVLREGRIINSCDFILNRGKDIDDEELIRMFLLRYYDRTQSIPRDVILEHLPEDASSFERWLTEKLGSSHGARVRLCAPKRGERASLLKLAKKNAGASLLRFKVQSNYEDKRRNSALLQLESALALPRAPLRIECYDISTFHGAYTVASMVVFSAGKPDKAQYRHFKIRARLEESNDFLSLQEVFKRRFRPQKLSDAAFGSKPDLLIVDGGKPQLNAAKQILDDFGICDIELAGLAKQDEELFVTWNEGQPVYLPDGSASLYLLKQIRDEAHRFAISYHRLLRSKGMTASLLDEIDGIGPKRKKALLKHFGSFKRLKEASWQDIAKVGGISKNLAQEVYLSLSRYNEPENPGQ